MSFVRPRFVARISSSLLLSRLTVHLTQHEHLPTVDTLVALRLIYPKDGNFSFYPILGNEIACSSTDVCAVSLKYTRVSSNRPVGRPLLRENCIACRHHAAGYRPTCDVCPVLHRALGVRSHCKLVRITRRVRPHHSPWLHLDLGGRALVK